MNIQVLQGLLLPFLGTSLGAAFVFFMRQNMSTQTKRMMTGFASGIMVSASFFSLLEPALEQAKTIGPVVCGFLLGMGFLLFLDVVIPHTHMDDQEEGPANHLQKSTKLLFAVTLHNLPEGMAVGIVYAGWLAHPNAVSGAFALALGIAIQNIPEGAIVSMPLHAAGMSKPKTFLAGVGSGAVEPIGALLTIWLSHWILPWMPALLAFAAGAMMYVVVEELIPEMSEGEHSNWGTICFALGFVLMLILE